MGSCSIHYTNSSDTLENSNILNNYSLSSKISDTDTSNKSTSASARARKSKLEIPDVYITSSWGTLRLVAGNNYLYGSLIYKKLYNHLFEGCTYMSKSIMHYSYFKGTKHPYVLMNEEFLLDSETKLYINGAEIKFTDEVISLMKLGMDSNSIALTDKITVEFNDKPNKELRLNILEPNSHFVWESNEWCMKCSLAEIIKDFKSVRVDNPTDGMKLKINELITKYNTVDPSSNYIAFGKFRTATGGQVNNVRPVEICNTFSCKWYTFRQKLGDLAGCKFTEEIKGKAVRTINLLEYLSYTSISSHTIPIHYKFKNGELICQALSNERVWQPDTIVELRVRVNNISDNDSSIAGDALPEYV